MKLAIGSAQFGLDYGVANLSGKISLEEGEKILETARANGIDTIDTAADYGQSESILGKLGVNDFRLVTKLPSRRDISQPICDWISSSISSSLEKLRVSALDGLLLHRPEQLESENAKEFIRAVEREKLQGRLKKFGISVYDPNEIQRVTGLMNVDVIQVPMNVFDRRFLDSSLLQKLHESGVEIHVRSAFLQGLLLVKLEDLPHKFKRWVPLFESWQNWLQENDLHPIQGCLVAVNDSRIDRVVIGFDNSNQAREVISFVQLRIDEFCAPHFNCNDIQLLNPSNWMNFSD